MAHVGCDAIFWRKAQSVDWSERAIDAIADSIGRGLAGGAVWDPVIVPLHDNFQFIENRSKDAGALIQVLWRFC